MAEIISCPNCTRKLQVPEQFFGQTVQCPQCQHRFTAASAPVSTQPISSAAAAAPREEPLPQQRRYEDDEPPDEYRRRRRPRYDDEFDDDRFDRPRRWRPYDKPHRGGLIMALGLVSLVGGFSFCLPVVIGPIAWGMGQYDLREMREGRMDPSGEGLTRAGQVLGIISTVLMVLAGCGLGFVFMTGMG